MPYAVVIWKRGNPSIDIAGLKADDLRYLEQIPCLANRVDSDPEGFVRFGQTGKIGCIQPAVVLTGLEVLGFRVITSTATPATSSSRGSSVIEYCWTLRREFSEPEPQD